jgi:hypothetical protein
MEDNHKKHYHYTPVLLEHSALNSIRTEMHRFGCYSAERKIRPCRFALQTKWNVLPPHWKAAEHPGASEIPSMESMFSPSELLEERVVSAAVSAAFTLGMS